MKNQTLRYYMHDGPSAFRFELAGDLNDEGARRLNQDWHTASSVTSGRQLIVDITFVTALDHAGRALLSRWHNEGAKLIAKSLVSRELAESIMGDEPLALLSAGDANSSRTWAPFRTSRRAANRIALLVAFSTLRAIVPSHAELANSNSAFSTSAPRQTGRVYFTS